ncbi:MAG TPA: LLM class flavin-dependent oxidoreductase [Chloroflexota bacterium]|jgi:alkanesulfonate monooxygenase SsuD/methylene tetrahydromethanopterin reductase-like flavin-dependent oxidoreductase (luciferase family)|nr:LLM class flavin-dependent oxidoreductase [Chloroflexota bacterium]
MPAARNPGLLDGNPLKLGLFGSNCSNGRSYTTVPERWDASWENNLELARLADESGLECMVPIARWKGYGGQTNVNGVSLESIAWACGLLAGTRRINVFCTIHVPLIHPIVAAKQMATVDHVGAGRLGVNVVCGWNEDEFQMLGVTKHEHDDRYAQGEEWWSIVKQVWRGNGAFDFKGQFYELAGVEGRPGPYADSAPLMMNAGSSPRGRDFAIQHSDMHFDGVRSPETSRDRIVDTKRAALALGRSVQVWTPVGVICRPSLAEAETFLTHLVDHADWGALGHLAALHASDARARTDTEGVLRRSGEGPLERQVLARGSYCAVGDPDHVATEIQRLHDVGFDGLVLNFVNYLDELPYFAQEVLPRLERFGLRTANRVATPAM